jgi:hypothetical protein
MACASLLAVIGVGKFLQGFTYGSGSRNAIRGFVKLALVVLIIDTAFWILGIVAGVLAWSNGL